MDSIIPSLWGSNVLRPGRSVKISLCLIAYHLKLEAPVRLDEFSINVIMHVYQYHHRCTDVEAPNFSSRLDPLSTDSAVKADLLRKKQLNKIDINLRPG